MKSTNLRTVCACALIFLASYSVAAEREDDAEQIAREFSYNWQSIEVVVFERLGVRETLGEEDRVPEHGDRTLPASFWTITDASDHAPGFGIDDLTRPAIERFQLGAAVGMPGFQRARVPAVNPTSATPSAPPVPSTDVPPPRPTPKELFRTELTEFEKSLAQTALTAQPIQNHRLQAAANRLVSQAGARILWHRRWTQPFGCGSAALPVYIQAGYPVLGMRTLEGTLSIRGTESFNTSARLWLHGPFQGQIPQPLPARASGETIAAGDLTDPFLMRHVLTESRNIKPGEVHYFDHPYFGMLISFAPVALPDSLVTAWQLMQSTASPPGSQTGVQQ